jgi:DNA-binding FadR family transcriptional regulator
LVQPLYYRREPDKGYLPDVVAISVAASAAVAPMAAPIAGAGRLDRQIAERIRARIVDGTFAPGSRLPAERELAHGFTVSRTSVREALIALEIGGLVEVRGGSGIYVADPLPFLRRLEAGPADGDPGPFELLRARWLVEGEVAALAAGAIDDAALRSLADALALLRRDDATDEEHDEADRVFHLGIAEASGNGVLVQTVRMYWDQRRGPMWQRLAERFRTPALRAAVLADHARILESLEQRSAPLARRAMRRHLASVAREFEKGWEARTTSLRDGGTPRLRRTRRAGPVPPAVPATG